MMYAKTPKSTKNPPWSGRNLEISKRIKENSNVLDLGCGSKDLLNYITPNVYLGVDYDNSADLTINFNNSFEMPVGKWDYIVCSGLLEYLADIDKFLETVSTVPSTYIFSYWDKNETLRLPNNLPSYSVKNFTDTINEKFKVIESFSWNSHTIYICKQK